jgi:hypothetical protein
LSFLVPIRQSTQRVKWAAATDAPHGQTRAAIMLSPKRAS